MLNRKYNDVLNRKASKYTKISHVNLNFKLHLAIIAFFMKQD